MQCRDSCEPITSREKMRQVLSVYPQQGAARLEKHQQKAKLLQAFAGTSLYDAHTQGFPSIQIRLPAPTSDPKILVQAAQHLLPRLTDGLKYVKAGVMLFDLSPATGQKAFEQFRFEHEERGIATLVDQVQRRIGSDMIGLGHGGLRPGLAWQMRRDMPSPRATTHWNEFAIVKAN
nr:DUF4113 domain-containing protein [Arthrobacter sp. efr-133-TYG-118]